MTDREMQVDAAAGWGQRYALASQEPDQVTLSDPTTSVQVYRRLDDETLEVLDHEEFLAAPRRAVGSAYLTQPESFALYVTEQHVQESTPTRMWADLDNRSVTALFNDHHNGVSPGWRDHSARFVAQLDQDWLDWRGRDGKLADQGSFGEFLEEHMHNVVKPEGKPTYPSAAEMLDVALTMSARRNVEFDSATRLQSGDVEFSFRETTTAQAGKITKQDVPERFAVQVSPFVGHPPVIVEARLRYRADRDGFRVGYKLLRPDLAEQAAFRDITTAIAEETPEDVPLLWGTRPDPVSGS